MYTYTAYILIAVNPYKKLDIYGDDKVQLYYGKPIGKLPPHVFAIADRAYRSMKASKRNQSIVVRCATLARCLVVGTRSAHAMGLAAASRVPARRRRAST